MKATEVTRWCEEGQLWAYIPELSLLEVTNVGGGCAVFQQWTPVQIDQLPVVLPLPIDRFRWLWCESYVDPSNLRSEDRPLRTGDIWMFPDTQELFFIGPKRAGGKMQLVADWDFRAKAEYSHHTLTATLYQPGPPPKDEDRSVIDRLLEDDLAV